MSQGCNVCRFAGAVEQEHIEHAHAVILVLMDRLREAGGKIDRLKELFSQQKKNRLILGLSNEVGTLRGELAVARRELLVLRSRLRDTPGCPEGELSEDTKALIADMKALGLSVEAGVDSGA
jgi:hypothetical protein